jgi:MFS family permease
MLSDWYNEKIKRMNYCDIGLVKLSTVAFTLFIISFLSAYFDKIISWRWVWLILFIIFAIKPLLKVLKKSEETEEVKVKKKKVNKKGAMELSIGTVVVIVIAITMLILGIVLVRSIMCSAVGLTGDLDNRIKGEIKDDSR